MQHQCPVSFLHEVDRTACSCQQSMQLLVVVPPSQGLQGTSRQQQRASRQPLSMVEGGAGGWGFQVGAAGCSQEQAGPPPAHKAPVPLWGVVGLPCTTVHMAAAGQRHRVNSMSSTVTSTHSTCGASHVDGHRHVSLHGRHKGHPRALQHQQATPLSQPYVDPTLSRVICVPTVNHCKVPWRHLPGAPLPDNPLSCYQLLPTFMRLLLPTARPPNRPHTNVCLQDNR